MPRECDVAILGVLIPPLQVYRTKQCGKEFWIDLLLWVLAWVFWPTSGVILGGRAAFVGWIPLIFLIAAVVYCFSLHNVEIAANIFCFLLPPLGLWIGTKKVDQDLAICILLWILLWLPGAIWAYHKV